LHLTGRLDADRLQAVVDLFTPTIEEGRIYVHFGSYGTACLDMKSGKVLWKRNDMECRHYRGPGSSPIIFEDLLILTFDGVDVQYLTALNKMTGETVWRTDRSTVFDDLDANGLPKADGDYRKGFSTPVIVEANGEPLMISPGGFSIFAYDPRSGKEIWNVPHKSHTPQLRPVYKDGIIYVMTGYSTELMAIRVDGQGDVTDTHVVWRKRNMRLPTTPSILLVDGLLYVGTNKGDVTCLDAESGEEIWEEHIGGNYIASPIYAAGRIYLIDEDEGKTRVIEANPKEFRLIAENKLAGGDRKSVV